MKERTKEVLKKVKKIEIKTKHLVEGLLQGAYHSVFKGRGIEFSEVREYVPGDDVRIRNNYEIGDWRQHKEI